MLDLILSSNTEVGDNILILHWPTKKKVFLKTS